MKGSSFSLRALETSSSFHFDAEIKWIIEPLKGVEMAPGNLVRSITLCLIDKRQKFSLHEILFGIVQSQCHGLIVA